MQGGAKEDLVHLKKVGKACDACRKDRKMLGCQLGCVGVNLFLRNLDWGVPCVKVLVAFVSTQLLQVCSAVACQKSRGSSGENAVG